MKRVACIGWYNHKNIGDDLFVEAFASLFPEHEFVGMDYVPTDINSQFDAVIIGGGSFLDQPKPGLERITLPLAYIGVGIGNTIHSDHKAAMARAKVVVARNESSAADVVAPDLVFAVTLPSLDSFRQKKEGIGVMVNSCFSPKAKSSPQQDSAWGWFTTEFAQCLDRSGEHVNFMSFCVNKIENDTRASAYIIDRMEKKDLVRSSTPTLESVWCEMMSKNLNISQRFHGLVISTMLEIPFVAISAHHKVESFCKELGWNGIVPYYGFSMDGFNRAKKQARDQQPLLKEFHQKARSQWEDTSSIIRKKLF